MKKCTGFSILMISRFIVTMLILCIGLALHPVSVFAASETEQNGKLGIANAVTAGEANTGTFSPSGDQDWYKITLATQGRLECSVTNPPANIRPYITLYNRHADYMYVTSSAVNDGDDVHLTYDVTEPGTYYIRVHDRDNDSSEETYTFTADFTPVEDTRELNNQLGAASLITGTSLTGFIFDRNDEDWFKIYAEATHTLSFTVAPPAEMRPNIAVYGPHANYLYVSKQSVNPGDTLILEHTVSETGFYYARLTDGQGLSHLSPYTMTVTGGNAGYVPVLSPVTTEQEDNDKMGWANLIALDASVSGIIGDAGDGDWYHLDIPQAGQLTVALASVPGNLELRFRLYNSSGGQILSGQPMDPGELFSLIYDVTTPDTYYLLVDDLDSAAYSTQAYTFSTSLAEVTDPFEPNDNYGDARVLEQLNRIEGFIFKTGDHDWCRISVAQAGDLRVILSDLPENISPALDIYNMSKEHLAGKSGTAGMDLELTYSVQAAGDYLIRVRDSGDNDESTESYTMTIHGADFNAFAPTASIDQIVPGSIIVGDSIQFTGSGFDSDGTITGYAWRSSIDGPLSSAATFSTSALSMGTHTIYFKVQDNADIWSTEDSEVVYVGSSVSDEVEENTPIGLANEIALDNPVLAKINQSGDQDFFKVYISRPGRLTCSVTNVPNNLRLYLTYYGRHLNYLYITGYAVQDGDEVSLAMNVTEPGFYYLKVHDRDSEFNSEFTYTLTASFTEAVDPQESNGSMLDAFDLTQSTVQGYIFPNGDEDWYRVWVDAGATLTAAVTNTASNLRPYITFYGRNREYLYATTYAENEGDNPPALSYTFNEAGFVYVRVHDRDSDYNWTQMYQLSLTGANPGYVPPESPVTAEVENNGVIADANLIALNTSVSGAMGEAYDNDWFKFEISSPGIIHTRLDPVPATMRGRVTIYRNDGSQIGGRDATNPGDLLTLDTRVTRPGLYMVRTEDLNRSTPQEAYGLATSFTPVSDIHEPNGNIGDASLLNGQNRTQGMIFDQGDEDWYQVTCDAGSTLQVTVADVPADIRPQIEFFNNSMTWLAGKTATNSGQELTLSYDIDTTAGYFIRVRHAGNNSYSTQPYTLIVNGAKFRSYTPLAVIDSVAPNPADAGETVTLEGHGQDADGEIIGYAWRSSLDGEISTSRVATRDNLSTGTHTLYFRVKDSDQNWSPETSTILYSGVPAPQEEEPNGEIGKANPMNLDTQYTGVMDASGDNDYFRIRISQPGRLTISATNPTGSLMRTYLTMYTLDADYAYATSSAANAGDPVTLTWDIVEPGDYFLKIHDANNNVGVRYTVTASLQMAPDPYEPNPDFTHATSLNIGDMLQGYIFPGGDEDWYKVSFTDPGTLSVSLTNIPENLRGYITIYDSNTSYTYVTAYANYDQDNVHLDYNVAVPGTYYIRIHDRDSDKNPEATYTLTTSFVAAPDPFEPNGDIWHSTILTQSPVNAYIFPANDEDYYKLYAEAGSELVIKVDNVPANLRPYLALYNANTGYMYKTATTDTEGSPVTLTYTVEDTGYYYLKIHDRDSDWSSASTYRLTVTGADLTYQPSDQPATTETEPNNEFRFATLVGTGDVTGTFGGDDDWYRFEVTEASRLTLSLTVPSTVRSVIKLYNANYSERASRSAENAGDFSWVTFDIDEPGTWYVRVYADGGTVSEESYQFSVSLDPAVDSFEPNGNYASAQLLTFGQPVQANIFPTADQDWFRMEVGEPGVIRFELGDVPENIEISLVVYNQNNIQVFSKEALNSGEPLEAIFAAEPGIYYAKIYDRGNNGESVALYTLIASLTPFEDAFEPNDRYSEATPLNEKNQVSGLIYPEGDYDWYVFTVSQPGTLKIQMTETGGIQPRIELYTDSKSQLSAMAAKNAGDDLLMTYEITEPDFYYLRINDDGNNNRSLMPYVLTIQGADVTDYYPVAEIGDMSPNPAIVGDLVTLTGSGTDEDGTVTTFEWVSDLDGALGSSAVLTTSSLSEGAHRITFRVQDNDGHWSGWVHKTLYVTGQILAEAEFNNDIAHANPIPLSTWVTGRILPKYDVDYYKIYVEERGYLSTLVDAVPQAMRAYITFYDGDGNYLYRTDSAQNDGEWFSYNQFIQPGWYYVKVHDRDSEAHEGTYGLFFNFTHANDIHEPNDSLGEATPITPDGTIPDARICRQGDEDWYRMEIAGKGRLSLSITEAPSAMRGYITIYNDNADYIYVTNYAYHDGEDVFLDYDVNSPGTYYVNVHERDNEAHTEPYTFTSQFMPVEDLYEENNSAGHATLMTQASVDAAIFPGGDADWYKVYAEAGASLSLSVTQVPSSMKTNIAIHDRDIIYTYISQSANNDGDNVFLTYSVPANGFYYIRITDSSNRSHLTSYRFTVQGGTLNYEPPFAPVATEGEPNGSFGEANDIALDTPTQPASVTGTIDPDTDYDWYRFYVNAPGVVTISHTNIAAGMISEFWVYNANSSQIGSHYTTNPGEDNILVMTVDEAGYYRVQLRDRNSTGSSSAYTLKVTHTAVVDGNEPNDNYGPATPLGNDTVQGYIFDKNDNDWYRIYVREPGILSVSLDVVPEDLRPRLRLYNNNKIEKASYVNTNPGVGGEDVITYNVPAAGFYFVRVYNEDDGYSASPYTLSITGADFSTAPLLSSIGNRTIDEAIKYSFTVDATDPDNEDELTFSATSLPTGASFDPDSQTFSWTPAYGQAGTYSGIHFVVSDGTYSDSEDITITINRVSRAPVLSPIGSKTGQADNLISFQISATDPDSVDTLTYSATGLPSGAEFVPETRTFTWTPLVASQEGLHEDLYFQVTDGVWTDFEYINIDVTGVSLPTVTTGGVSDITQRTATVEGEATATGGSSIIERGVVYSSVSTEPTIGDDDKISADTGGTGAFSVTLTGLTPGVTYYVRAYATNGAGTAYGEPWELTTQSPAAPSVITGTVTLITDTGATVSGEVTSNGGSTITDRGMVYSSASTEPTIEGDKIPATTADTGIFQVELTGLSANIKYYVRAYATNDIGTNYGETIFFFTLTPPAPHISVAPDSHDFGMKEINTQFVNQKFTVTNTGTTDLIIGTISITGGDAGEFTILNDLCSDKTITKTNSDTLEVAFLPATAGLKEAILSIPSNDPDSPVLNVPLQGMRFLKGDVNGDGIVDLKDAVLALQIMTGITPDSDIQLNADVNGDGKIGMAEVVYILQYVAGLRQ